MRFAPFGAGPALLSAAVLLSGCAARLPEPYTEEELASYLPEELSSLTLDGTELRLGCEGPRILERNTDKTHQTDDVTCLVTETGSGITVDYTCVLSFAYVREEGWTLRDWRLEGDPVVTLSEERFLTEAESDTRAALLGREEFDEASLLSSSWEDNDCSLTYSVTGLEDYVRTEGTVTVEKLFSETVTESGLLCGWTEDATESLTRSPELENSIWCFTSEEERLEAVIRITEATEDSVTFSGLLRQENSRGYLKEETLEETTVPLTVSEYGGLSFELGSFPQGTLGCTILTEKQWASLDGVWLAELDWRPEPLSGDLSVYLKLETEEEPVVTPQPSASPASDSRGAQDEPEDFSDPYDPYAPSDAFDSYEPEEESGGFFDWFWDWLDSF